MREIVTSAMIIYGFYSYFGQSIEEEKSIKKFGTQLIGWMIFVAIGKLLFSNSVVYTLGTYVGLYFLFWKLLKILLIGRKDMQQGKKHTIGIGVLAILIGVITIMVNNFITL